MLNKKLLLTAAIALSTVISGNALAVTQDVGASVTTHGAISVSNVQDMNFGHIDYDASNPQGVVRIGTNGTTILTNNAGGGLVLSGTTNAGSFDIASDGTAVEVSCDTNAVLANNNGDVLTFVAPLITDGAGDAPDIGTSCQGIGSNPLIASGITSIKLGGQLAIGSSLGGSSDIKGGTYSTANAGGSPITVSVVYQ